MWPVLKLPSLSGPGIANLAGLLPLSSLIEFIDTVTKLHSYELSGVGFLWNWPITPAGARLLLDRSRIENEVTRKYACILDGDTEVPPLHCVDGRWGDNFVCSNRYTIRECITLAPLIHEYSPEGKLYRVQYLQIVHIFHQPCTSVLVSAGLSLLHKVITIVGWFIWGSAVVLTAVAACPYAVAYLVTTLVTGVLVRLLFGGSSRRLNGYEPGKRTASKYRRMVVVTENFNATEWTIFLGDHMIIDSLLNKPLESKEKEWRGFPRTRYLLRILLRVTIIGQWAMVVAVSALQNWDAIWISVWIVFCACISAFVHTPDVSVRKWLRFNAVGIEKIRVGFTGRRAMLSAMATLNPDGDKKSWIDPILAVSDSRKQWEGALDKYISTGELDDTIDSIMISAIQEGVKAARQVQHLGELNRSNLSHRDEQGA